MGGGHESSPAPWRRWGGAEGSGRDKEVGDRRKRRWKEDLKAVKLLRGGDKRWEGAGGKKEEEVGGRIMMWETEEKGGGRRT